MIKQNKEKQSKEQLFESGGSGKKKQLPMIITVAVIAVLLIAALLYVLPGKKGAVAGKAVHQTAEAAFAAGDQSIRFESATLDGAVGDQFALPVFIKTSTAITQIDFELTFPANKLELVPTGCIAGTNCQITTHTSLGTVGYPSGTDPTWSVFGTGAGETGADLKVITFTFRVIGGSVEDTAAIGLTNVKFRAGTTEVASGLSAATTLTIANTCTDVDNDGFGAAGIDSRACTQKGNLAGTTNSDCDDGSSAIKPGATETCDGVDNDCDGATDAADTVLSGAGEHNDKELGVCTGQKVCTGAGGFQNSYDDASAAAAISFTSPQGTSTQQQLYSSTGELCDFFDNDCDGSVNEEIDCNLGAASIIGFPPGNVFIDYNTDNTQKDPQELKLNDRLVFNKMKNYYEAPLADCGGAGLPPCGPEDFTASSKIYYCANGVYFIESTSTSGTATKFSPTGNKETGISTAVLGTCE